jgi:iron complex outermembrane receptor protein
MNTRMTPIAAAAALALAGSVFTVQAQQAEPAPADAKPAAPSTKLETVVVTGIRASREQSIAAKRNADSVVDVVTSEDIGKMPDKNVADAIQRVPGVNTSSAAGGEGGFDENDRVSIRGTSPSLTQTLINGHSVATGDWFILDQFQTVGRSVSFTLLPSELVGKVTVHKSATADLVEGGVAGAVNIETRKPLEFRKSLTMEASVQGVYADLPKTTDPQLSALINWKNEANTAGVLVQAFSETRHVRRDGQEILGYVTIDPASAIAQAHPEVAGLAAPDLIGAALFTQTRKRQGGSLDIQVKPTNDLTLDLNGLFSHLAAENYNRNFMAWPSMMLNGLWYDNPADTTSPSHIGLNPTSYTVRNGTLVAAQWAQQSNLPSGVVDDITRPGASAETYYLDFDAKLRVNDRLTLSSQLGYTHGVGKTSSQPAYEGNLNNGGLNFSMNGLASPTTVSFPGINPSNFAGVTTGWAWDSNVSAIDKETYAQADGELAMDRGLLESLKFGARLAKHTRQVEFPFDGGCSASCFTTLPAWDGSTYPSNFGKGIGNNAGFPANLWQLSPGTVAAYYAANGVPPGPARQYWPGEFKVEEQDSAAYLMGNFAGSGWRGNVGLRIVGTKLKSTVNISPGTNPITTSDFGPFTPTEVSHNYLDVLPSANIKFDVTKDLVVRGAIARTMARPDFSALGGSVSLDDLNNTGTGGNPDLKPIRSTNFDLSLEWYYQPKALIALGLFYMDLSSYVTYGTTSATYFKQTPPPGHQQVYQITRPLNTSGTNKGFELALQQPIGAGFGINANYTYADGKEKDGSELVGSSKNTYNLEGYFENDRFSTRLAYTYRSDFLVGLDRSFAQHEAAEGSLAASINYKLNDRFSLTFDALNLNNPTLKMYGNNKDQPRAFYSSGRQFYFGVRMQM